MTFKNNKHLQIKPLRFSLIALCLFVINSCKNDLKLNAPYKEIPSIYAVLNPNDKIQMIRINKVFLGEGDANKMAQIADSINYPAGDLIVTLYRTDESGHRILATPTGNKETITFRDSVIEAKDGAFSKTQRVYVTSDSLFTTGIYHLSVKNKKTDNTFTAKATSLPAVKGNQGVRPLNPPYYPYGLPIPALIEFVDYVSLDGTVKFAPNVAAFYQLTIRVHFYDSVGFRYYKYVDYVLGTKSLKDVQKFAGQDFLNYTFKKDDFFGAMGVGLSRSNLNNNIPGRKAYKIEYLIYSTTQDYMDYVQYVTPSLSITQNKPLYSNFDNKAALGLFTFRTRVSVVKEMATIFISEFAYNPNTCAYQFVTASGSKPGCR